MKKCINRLRVSTTTFRSFGIISTERINFRRSTKEFISWFDTSLFTVFRICFTVCASLFKSISNILWAISTFWQPWFFITVTRFYTVLCKGIFKSHILNHVFYKVVTSKSLCKKLWRWCTSGTLRIFWIISTECSLNKLILSCVHKHV